MSLSGLTQTDSSAIIDPYKTRFQNSGESYSIAGGITAGTVIGIANFVFPFIAALRTDLKRPRKFIFLITIVYFRNTNNRDSCRFSWIWSWTMGHFE